MQAQVQIILYQLNELKYNTKSTTSNLKSMQIVGFEQTSKKFTEIFIL